MNEMWDMSRCTDVVSNLPSEGCLPEHALLSGVAVTVLPASATLRLVTMQANQGTAEIQVMENLVWDDVATLEESRKIANAIVDLPPGLPTGTPIEVTIALDEAQMLQVTARELTGNRTIPVNMETKELMTEDVVDLVRNTPSRLEIL